MPYENPYIDKIQDYDNIIIQHEEMRSYRGKWQAHFGNNNPLHLEIGCGMGNFLKRECEAHPDINYIGMEIKYKRLCKTMDKCLEVGRDDVILLKEYGERIDELFGEDELDTVYLLYPDPWPKKRHHKNRLIQPGFLKNLKSVVKPGGVFIFETDDGPYFEWTRNMIRETTGLEITYENDNYGADKIFSADNATEFEVIWRSEGRTMKRLEVRVSGAS